MLTHLKFLISTVRLFHSFIRYRKKDFLNDFILEGKGVVAKVKADLNKANLIIFFRVEIQIFFPQHLLAKECKPNSS